MMAQRMVRSAQGTKRRGSSMSERVNLPNVVEVEVRVEGDHTAEADIHPVGHTGDGPGAGAERSTLAGGGRGLRTAETGTGTGTPGGNIPDLDPDPCDISNSGIFRLSSQRNTDN